MEILAYSGKLFASAVFVAQIFDEAQDMFTLEGKPLQTWLTGVPATATVTFESNGITITLTLPPECKMTVPEQSSLDTTKWPFWDTAITQAQETATLPALRFRAALEYAKKFASTDESKSLDLCAVAVKDGCVYATDRNRATMISVAGLGATANFKIHQTDVSSVIGFLPKDGDITIQEYSGGTIFKRGDGVLMGCGAPDIKFPFFKRPEDTDHYCWEVNKEDIITALPALYAWSDDKDNRLGFNQKGTATIEMTKISKNNKPSTKQIDCLGATNKADAPVLPDGGFAVSYKSLQEVLQATDLKTIKIGVNLLKKTGYLRFMEKRFADEAGNNGDEYLTIMVWLY
jgi:hypothetical protein